MSKDILYIDTEDDITSIIDRVKTAKSDIVALVPPKRTGVLQSVVNLKLLQRAAGTSKKRVVLITNDPSLQSLAGGVNMPTAKNLQSRPEVAAVSALKVDDDDVINGDELPVGDVHSAMGDKDVPTKPEDATDEPSPAEAAAAATKPTVPSAKPTDKTKPKGKGAPKIPAIPDFLKFRKRIFIIAALVIALIIFIYWAYWIAPHASVAITAKTQIANVERSVTLDPAAAGADASKNVLKPVTQQIKKTASVDFDATGKKDVGEKASGTVVVNNCESPNNVNIPQGTAVSVNGLNFITASELDIPGGSASRSFGPCDRPGTASVRVNAQEIGDKYNIAGGTRLDVAGTGDGITAVTNDGTSGGSKKQVSVVSATDVANARQKLTKQDEAAVRTELSNQFSKDQQTISESFKAETATPSTSPAVGQEASKGKVSAETTYRMVGLEIKDFNSFLDASVKEKMDKSEQQSVYDNGRKDIKITNFQYLSDGKSSMRIATTGYIGSKIDQADLKQQMVGKRYGEIESLVKQVPNVERVDINFSPFWVNSAPEVKKIDLSLKVVKSSE